MLLSAADCQWVSEIVAQLPVLLGWTLPEAVVAGELVACELAWLLLANVLHMPRTRTAFQVAAPAAIGSLSVCKDATIGQWKAGES